MDRICKQNFKRTIKRQQVTAVWRNGGFSASFDSFAVGSSAVLRLNFCAKNPPLRQAANRYTYALILLYPTLAVAYFLSVYSVL
jgi:hypothetical protein